MKNAEKNYEFRYMDSRERLKIAALKLVSLCWIGLCLVSLVFHDTSLASKLNSAGGCTAGAFLYLNLFHVKSELMELFEPPYQYHGIGLIVISAAFTMASMWATVTGS